MAALSEFLSHLYTMTAVFFTLLLIDAVLLLRSFVRSLQGSDEPLLTASDYFDLIEERVPTLRYQRVAPETAECAVCLSGFEEEEPIREPPCRHTFHRDCLDAWLRQDCATCPLCRRTVLPEEALSEFRRMRDPVEYDGSDEELILLLSAVRGDGLHRLLWS